MIKYNNFVLVYSDAIPGSFIRGQKDGDSGNSNRWAGKAGSTSIFPPSFGSLLSQPKAVAASQPENWGRS
jgi:hypothetical protein